MEAGLQRRIGPKTGSALVIAFAAALAIRAAPLVAGYLGKLRGLHAGITLVGAAAVAVAAFGTAAAGTARRSRVTGAVLALLAVAMVVLSGNLVAAAAAAGILAATFVVGDAVYRLLRRVEAGTGDLSSAFAAGLAALAVLVLLLGEAGGLSRASLLVAVAAVVGLRWRRLARLLDLARASARVPFGDAPRPLESAWLAFAALVLVAIWAGAQAPDVSWDGLAYHLPEARDIALSGGVRALPDLHPQSLLWRAHDAYLAIAFLFGGERVVPFLQFAIGLFVFGAALALARRVGCGGAAPLIVLALAAFPTAMLQLKAAYVDWPAALLTTASAAELAALRNGRAGGRLRAAGFLFGAAIAVKVFALFALPALAWLAWRGRPRPALLVSACACALLPLAPWLAWSQKHAGFFLAPYAASSRELASLVSSGGGALLRSPASGAAGAPASLASRTGSFIRLPFDLVYHSSRFEANGDGYNGILILLLLLGLAGWSARRRALFLAVTLPFLVPWSLLYLPSIRYLFPVYPLFAVFTAEGLARLTGRFSDTAGSLAGLSLLLTAALFPVQGGSSGLAWQAAFGRLSWEEVRARELPSLPFRARLSPEDRVLFLGESDRFDCPAGTIWRSEYLPVAGWGADAQAWRSGVDALGITHVLWRRDRMASPRALEALADQLVPDAENGPSVLYRLSGTDERR